MSTIVDQTKAVAKVAELTSARARRDAKAYAAAPERPPVRIMDAADLMKTALAPVRYVIPGWMPEGLLLLVANPKIGKSTLILQAAVALAGGGEFWGEQVPRAKALMIDLETNERRLRRKLEGAGVTGLAAGALLYATDWPKGIYGVDEIARTIERDPLVRLVVIDTLQRFRESTGGKNAYAADYDALAPLQQLCRDHPGLTIVVVHHKRKPKSGGDDDPLDSINGSAALSGAADAIWILSRRGDDFTLHVQGRDWERDEDEFKLERRDGRWELSDAPRFSQADAQVLKHLEIGDGMTPTQLGKALDISKQAAHQRLRRMGEAGLIVCREGAWHAVV